METSIELQFVPRLRNFRKLLFAKALISLRLKFRLLGQNHDSNSSPTFSHSLDPSGHGLDNQSSIVLAYQRGRLRRFSREKMSKQCEMARDHSGRPARRSTATTLSSFSRSRYRSRERDISQTIAGMLFLSSGYNARGFGFAAAETRRRSPKSDGHPDHQVPAGNFLPPPLAPLQDRQSTDWPSRTIQCTS